MGKAFEYLNMLPGDTAEEVLQLRDRIFNAGAPDLPVGTPQPPFPYEAEVPQPDASVSGRACMLFFTCQAEASQPGAALSGKHLILLSGKRLILQVSAKFGWCLSKLPSENHQRLLFIVKQKCHSLALPSPVSTSVFFGICGWCCLDVPACTSHRPCRGPTARCQCVRQAVCGGMSRRLAFTACNRNWEGASGLPVGNHQLWSCMAGVPQVVWSQASSSCFE